MVGLSVGMGVFEADHLRQVFIWAPVVLLSISVHEFLHAWSAVKYGDPTPELEGRVTLNPLAHLDLIGTIAILFFPIGWAKPVPINPFNLRRPRRDGIIVSAAGVCGNMALAIGATVFIVILALIGLWARLPDGVQGLISWGVGVNYCLAIFNLLPIHPLDGSHILSLLLPAKMAEKYDRLAPYGPFIILLLVLTGFINGILQVPLWFLSKTLTLILSLAYGL